MLKFLWNRIRRLGLLYNGRRDSKEPRLKCFHNGIILIEDRSSHKNMDFFCSTLQSISHARRKNGQ